MAQVFHPICSEFALLAVYSQLRLSKFVKEHFKRASSHVGCNLQYNVESDYKRREPDDFSYSCAAVDKISTGIARRAVPLR